MALQIRRCYVLPSARQTRLIEELETPGEHLIVTSRDIFRTQTSPAAAAALLLERPIAHGAAVLCMNELAVYVLGSLEHPGDVGFMPELLSAVTKSEMWSLLRRAGVPLLESTTTVVREAQPMPRELPFVIKPEFGFASQLVMRIEHSSDWARFLIAASDSSLWPQRQQYAETLFGAREGLLDRFVIQPDKSAARFLSVPFIFDQGEASAFVTEGIRADVSAITNFAWRDFRAPTSLTDVAVTALEGELAEVAQTASCRPGVYEAELLWTPTEHWILEFSPRPTGGLVPDLVAQAYGLDIDRAAIELFRGDQPVIRSSTSPDRFLGKRVTGPSMSPSDGAKLVCVDERDSAGTLLRDEIWRLAPEA